MNEAQYFLFESVVFVTNCFHPWVVYKQYEIISRKPEIAMTNSLTRR